MATSFLRRRRDRRRTSETGAGTRLKIDFVSDIACPWCAVGLHSLERALARLDGEVPVDVRFQPFELNPALGPDGEDAQQHLARKYGLTPEQLAQNRQVLVERGAAVGFAFGPRSRIWNTFDAHRLLYWAGLGGQQRELKHALLRAYHGEDRNPSDPEVLVDIVTEAGLDPQRAREILASDEFAAEVREREAFYQAQGIRAVPSLIVNGRHLIQGGQPPEAYEEALRRIAAEGD